MGRLSLRLLGRPQVHHAGRALKFPTQKALALLIYLAVEGGLHARAKLIALFWPESDAPHGQASLRNTLARLRTALGEGQDHLLVEEDSLGLGPDVDLDLRALEDAGAEPAELMAAADHIRGEFLEGFSLRDAPAFDDWASLQRQHAHRQMSRLLDRLSRLQAERGEVRSAVETARRWVAQDSLNEIAHRRLMQLHFAAGDRAAALQAYAACRDLLREELGIEPAPETVALAERIRAAGRRREAERDRPSLSRPRDEPVILPFVGRSLEHSQLVAAFEAARQGETRAVALEGEAGIGKTRLATEFLGWAESKGAALLKGEAFEAGGRLPYQPVVEALRSFLSNGAGEQGDRSGLSPAPLLPRSLSPIWLAELSRLLPELRDQYPDLPAPTGDEALARTRLPEAVARLGVALADEGQKPLVLFIDDLQWADMASLDLVHYLVRRWRENRSAVLCLLAVRSEALATSPSFREWLLDVGRAVPLVRLALGPITAADTRQLLDELAAGTQLETLGEWLFAETRGQPFFMDEMLKLLVERGVLEAYRGADGAWSVALKGATSDLRGLIPPGLREAILARLGRLTPVAMSLLTAAAVVGRACSFELLCPVADVSERDGLPALDELLSSRMLLETGEALRPYTFAHDKVRDIVYTEAGVARRRLYHRRAFGALEVAAAPPGELAHHALVAGLERPAFRYGVAAGDAALRLFAVRNAIEHYEAIRRLDVRPAVPLDEWEHLYRQLGRAYELSGSYPQAEPVYEEMLALARQSGAPKVECAALNRLATLAIHGHRFNDAVALLRQAAAIAESAEDKVGLARTEWGLSQLHHHSFDFRTSGVHAEHAVALARELGEPELMAGTLNSLAYAQLLQGRLETGEAHMRDARSRYAALGNRAMEADCLTALAAGQIWQGYGRAGIEAARAARAISLEIENPWGQIYAGNWLAIGLADQGDYEEALSIARASQQLAHGIPLIPVSIVNLIQLGSILRSLVAPEAALEVHLEAKALIGGPPSARSFAEVLAAELCADFALLGDREQAHAFAREALSYRTYAALPLAITPRWLETEALVRGGDVELALEDVRRWGELAGHIPRLRVAHLRSLAVLCGAGVRDEGGITGEAVDHLQAAAALAEEIGLPGELWQLYAALGERQRAAEIVQALAAKIEDERLREGFLAGATPVIREA